MSAVIAPAAAHDRDAVVDLLASQFEEHAIALPPARLRAAVDGVFSDAARGRFLLALEGERAVGLAYLSFQWSLEHGGRAAWLEELYVLPAHRGRGVGARLLRAALGHAAEAGCAAVDLEVETSHARVESLYLREGFRRHTRARRVRRLQEQNR